MPDALAPLRPLGAPTSGLTPDLYETARRRQVMADALVADAKSPNGGGGSLLGALGQGLKGYAGASMQQQNAADLARFAPTSPQAVNAFLPPRPFALPDPVAAIGSVFGRIGDALGIGQPAPQAAQPGLPTPDPDARAGASTSSTPDIGAGPRWGERD